MHIRRLLLTLVLISAFTLQGLAYGAESKLLKSFLEAYDSNNALGMTAVVEKNLDKVPGEIKRLIEESQNPKLTKDLRAEKIYIAELLSREYKNLTDDAALLIEVKQVDFNSMLHPPVRPKAKKGIQTITIPTESEKEQNVFKPDNLVIKAGETVRWTNKDKVVHVFASMPLIGEVGLFSPNIQPGKSWEYKFEKPGVYYYLCFIHQGMVGKVTVEGEEKDAAKTKGGEKGVKEKKSKNGPEKKEE
ncbi:MAG: plastocyanin/azurin family copper-binding protein [Thermodesulfobacteriota bacterium]